MFTDPHDIHELINNVGIGVAFVGARWWKERQKKKAQDLANVTPVLTTPISPRRIHQLEGRIDELELTSDTHDLTIKTHEKRIGAVEKYVSET